MGVKISTTQGVLPVAVQKGKIVFKDRLDKLHVGTIGCDIDFEIDSSFYPDLLFIQIVQKGYKLVCRYDSTWSLYKNDTMELLDMGVFTLDEPAILETEYETIGAYLYDKIVYTLVLDTVNKKLVHALKSEHIEAIRHFKFDQPFVYEVDLPAAQAEAHLNINNSPEEVFIVTQYGRLNTEGILHEISSTL